jgi:hypothetical protein
MIVTNYSTAFVYWAESCCAAAAAGKQQPMSMWLLTLGFARIEVRELNRFYGMNFCQFYLQQQFEMNAPFACFTKKKNPAACTKGLTAAIKGQTQGIAFAARDKIVAAAKAAKTLSF